MPIVQQGQSLLDMAVQHCGDAGQAFEIGRINGGLSITHQLTPGMSLEIPEPNQPGIVKFLRDNNMVPATGTSLFGAAEVLEGIDYWEIEVDFIVS
jgi:hypothetical protein